MSLHFTLNQSTLTSFQQSTTPIAEKSSKTIPRKTTDLKNDSFEQLHSSTPKSTKPSANDGKGLMLIAGITTLLLVGGGLLAWYLSTKKGGKPFGNLPPKAGGEVGSKTNQAVTGGSSMGKTDKILTATELRTELENQLATIKANAEQWLSGQKQDVDQLKKFDKETENLASQITERLATMNNNLIKSEPKIKEHYIMNKDYNTFTNLKSSMKNQILGFILKTIYEVDETEDKVLEKLVEKKLR
jgi:hypothetical protein